MTVFKGILIISGIILGVTIFLRIKGLKELSMLHIKQTWKRLIKIKDKLEKRIKGKKDYYEQKMIGQSSEDLENLAPRDSIGKVEPPYFAAITRTLKDESVFNVALSGPYGSGKSSIICAYLREHPGIRFLNISLASFVSKKIDGKQNSVLFGEEDEELIETGILKQLFYKVDSKRIPQSRYRKLFKLSKGKILIYVIGLLITAISLLMFLKPDIFIKLESNLDKLNENMEISYHILYITLVIIVIAVVAIVSKFMWWLLSKYKIRELNINKGTSIEEKKNDNESILNKNMDEIVYFFEMTNYEVVFIEDLDRFKNADIFIKLRELNKVINSYERIKRRIVFVYAVVDDMFDDKDRTKFFDMIIPVIPIINSTNSEELLRNRIEISQNEGSDVFNKLSDDFITQIAPFIGDMRILTNLCNEFVLYKKILYMDSELNLNDENIMALILFKNLYPKQFALLQDEEGIVKEAFKNGQEFIKNQCKELDKKIEEIEKELRDVGDKVINDLTELKKLMSFELTGNVVSFRNIVIERLQTVNITEFMDATFDVEQIFDKELVVNYNLPTNNSSTYNNSMIEETSEIVQRWYRVKRSEPQIRKMLWEELEEMRLELRKLSSRNMKDLLNEFGSRKVVAENIQENKLLVYLLQNGYIDESYANYMNYFHGNSMTTQDMQFVLSVRYREGKEYNYPLSKVKKVVQALSEYEFDEKAVYNYRLMDYFLNEDFDSKKLLGFFRQLCDCSEESWEFIEGYIERGENIESFVRKWINTSPMMWAEIYHDSRFIEGKDAKYFNLIIRYADDEDMERLFEIDEVQEYMLVRTDILQILTGVEPEKIITLIGQMKIKFESLDTTNVPREILEFIFEENHYNINRDMIRELLKYLNKYNEQEFDTRNYTYLKELNYEPLMENLFYVSEPKGTYGNFYQYIRNVILNTKSNTEESKEAVVDILNKSIGEKEMAKQIIKMQNVFFEEFEECCIDLLHGDDAISGYVNEIWDEIIINEKVLATWKNVEEYWKHFDLSENLHDFIMKNSKELLEEEFSLQDNFIGDLLNEEFEDDLYRKLLKKLKKQDINIVGYSENQIRLMLEVRYVEFDKIDEKVLKQKDVELFYYFIQQYENEYFKSNNLLSLNNVDKGYILDMPAISITHKKLILQSLKVQDFTESLAKSLSMIKGISGDINYTVIDKCWSVLNKESQYLLLSNHVLSFTISQVSNKLLQLGENELANNKKRHLVKLEYNDKYYHLAEALSNKGYLTSFTVGEEIKEDQITFSKKKEKIIKAWVKKETPGLVI